ncbi:MAG TPA: transglycosylase family protein [Actinomycetales bacterium]|nr:transglycosylase family protein [Actinomycetales bacterium]
MSLSPALPRTSYAGQHRAPAPRKRTVRALVGVSATGALLAAPLVMASPAQAASSSTWNRLAACESGGNWGINTGNGYYGGLQFSAQTWAGFGGRKYASRADRASRSQQILIAEKVLDAQGWNAWPSCSRKLGLSRADKGGSPRVSRSTTRKSVKKKATSRAASVSRGSKGTYTVRSGDTLGKIAARKHVRGGWRALYSKNASRLHGNPNRIYVGQRLVLPR